MTCVLKNTVVIALMQKTVSDFIDTLQRLNFHHCANMLGYSLEQLSQLSCNVISHDRLLYIVLLMVNSISVCVFANQGGKDVLLFLLLLQKQQ